MAEKGTLYMLTDVDKVQVAGPFAGGTVRKLYSQNFSPVDYERELIKVHEHVGILGIALLGWELFFHGVRWGNPDGQQSLPLLKEVAEQAGYDTKIIIASGRKPHLHQLTHRQLRHLEEAGLIDEWRLNPGYKSAAHKALLGVEYLNRPVEEGKESLVMLLEDDTEAAVTFGGIDPDRALTLLQVNISNDPGLLKRAGVELPPNVRRVKNFKDEGVKVLKEKLAA